MTQTPRPTEHHERLRELAGSWSGEETIFPSPWDPQGGQARGRIEARLDLDGFFLLSDYVHERDGKVAYRGHGVYGWSQVDRCYTQHWFDGLGGIPTQPARGTWEGNVLTFSERTPQGHSRYVYTFLADGRYTFRLEQSLDLESWAPFLEATYIRR